LFFWVEVIELSKAGMALLNSSPRSTEYRKRTIYPVYDTENIT
jgi:hypothetical protein